MQQQKLLWGHKVAPSIKQAMVVAGSGLVKAQAEQEGLDKIFMDAGFEWREPGCSMCLAMNADKLQAGEHCASTSNRNFEGRQGNGGRTHLVSPYHGSSSGNCRAFCGCADVLIMDGFVDESGNEYIRIDGDFTSIYNLKNMEGLINANDEISVILRGHLILEEFLNLWIEKISIIIF